MQLHMFYILFEVLGCGIFGCHQMFIDCQSEGGEPGTDYWSPWVRGWSGADHACRVRLPTRGGTTLASAVCMPDLTV